MCFESTSSSQSTSATTQPQYLTDASEALTRKGLGYLNNHKYQGYTGPTEAAFGSTFGTAEQAATARANGTDPNFAAGSNSLLQGLGLAGDTASKSVTDLMNPYTSAVLNPQLQAIAQAGADQNKGLATGATMAGAFGDTGYGTQKALNDRNTTQAVSNATGTAYNQAYNTALSTQQNALQQLFGGVGAASNLGGTSNSSQTALQGLLASMGATKQAAGQTGINTAINVNDQNQMGFLKQLGLLGGTLNTAPHDSTVATQGTQTQPNNVGFGLLGSLLGGL